MKKLSFKGLLLIALSLTAYLANAQSSKWLLKQTTNSNVGVYDMNAQTPSLSSTLTTSTTGSEKGGREAVYDNNGNMLFSIYAGKIFSSTNTFVTDLPVEHTYAGSYPGLKFIWFLNPMTIVPVPGTCKKFYVIYTLTYGPGDLLGAHKLVYCVVDVSSGTPAIDPNSLDVYLVNGTDYGFRVPKPLAGSNFAISKSLNAQNERYMYLISTGQTKVDKFLISGAGISFVNTIFVSGTDATYSNSQFNFGELELSPDQQHLAFTAYSGSTQLVYQVNLSNYNYSSFEREVLPITYNFGQLVYGLEYSNSSDKLFMSTISGLLYYKSVTGFSSNFFLSLSSTNGQFAYSNLELGKSGYVYAVASNGDLYAINTTPSIPTLANTNIVIANDAGNLTYFNFPLPIQISGEDYNNFSGAAVTISSFNINGVAAGNSPPQFIELYTCNAITLNNTSIYSYTPPLVLHENGRCRIQSCDAAGNVISGTGYLNYSTNWQPGLGSLNLKSLPSYIFNVPNNTWLADPVHAGYYKITLETRNICDIIDTKVAYIKLNAPPSPTTLNVQVNDPTSGVPCDNQTNPGACIVGPYTASFNLGGNGSTFTSNNITSYTRKIEEVDCTTGSVISTYYQDATSVIPANPSGNLTSIPFANALSAATPPPIVYFPANRGHCYKFTVYAYNACAPVEDWTYFKISEDPNVFRPAGPKEDSPSPGIGTFTKDQLNDPFVCKLYPNPGKDIVTLNYFGNNNGKASISIYDMQGRLVINMKNLNNSDKNKHEQHIDISKLPAGMYFYKFNNGAEVVSGQISVL